jgi:hypothetical protein
MLLPVVVGTCYFFNLYLVPLFLLKKKYFRFGLYSVYMIVLSLYLEMIVIILSFIILANYSANNMSPVSSDVFVLAALLYLIVFIFSFTLLIREFFQKEQQIREFKEKVAQQRQTHLQIRSDRQLKQLELKEILYIESLSDYVQIFIREENHPVVTKEKISRLSERLPHPFLRVHRSFCVNMGHVSSFINDTLMIDGTTPIPVSRTYKEQVKKRLTNL